MSHNLSKRRNKFVAVKKTKKRTVSSTEWLKRQLNDPFVIQAQVEGYRSRSAYKLIEIQDKFQLFKPHMRVVDLGAAPGGWSQVVRKIVQTDDANNDGKIVAVDLLPIDPISGVDFFQADFFDAETENLIMNELPSGVDIVMSDMAANTTGHRRTDHIRTLALCEHAFYFALKVLKPGGHFIAKIFRGGAENNLLAKVKLNFHLVKHFKPMASRQESTEIYMIALNRKHD